MTTRVLLNEVPDVVAHTLAYVTPEQKELKDAQGVGFIYHPPSDLSSCRQVCRLWTSLVRDDLEAKNKDFWANLPAWMASSVHVVEVRTGRKVAAFTPNDRRAAERLLVDHMLREQHYHLNYNKPGNVHRLTERDWGRSIINLDLRITDGCCKLMLLCSNLSREVKQLTRNARSPDLKIHEANQGNALLSRVTHLELTFTAVPSPEVYLCKNVQSLVIGYVGPIWSLEPCFQLFPKLRKVYLYGPADLQECQKICNTRNAWITYTAFDPDTGDKQHRVCVGPGVSKTFILIKGPKSLVKAIFFNPWALVTLKICSLWWRFCQWIRGIPLEQRAPHINNP